MKSYSSKIILLLIIGLIIRIVLAASTFHPDTRILSSTSQIILKEGYMNPYEYALTLPEGSKRNIFLNEVPDDLPLQYWILVPINILTRPLVDAHTENNFLSNFNSLIGQPSLLVYLLVLKLPLIIFDLLAGVLLMFFVAKTEQLKMLFLWLFNPMTLWATAMVGQVDIIPTLFVLVALLLYQKDKNNMAILALGIGGALKSFPFLLAPFFILREKTLIGKIKLSFLLFIPLLVSLLPYINFESFRRQALFAPQMGKILFSKIELSGGESIFLTIFILVLLYIFYNYTQKALHDILVFSTILLLSILSLTHFHIQWFLWVVPLLLILFFKGFDLVQKQSLTLIAVSLIGMLFLFESSLQVRLFAPIIPALKEAVGLSEILDNSQLIFFRSLMASLFAGGSVVFIGSLLYKSYSKYFD